MRKNNKKNVSTTTETTVTATTIETLESYRQALADGTVDTIPAIQLVNLLNNKTEMGKCVGDEGTKLIDQTDKNNKAENEQVCIDTCKTLVAMERDEMFRVYCTDPTYKGHRFTGKRNEKTGLYELTECKNTIKFARLEKVYKDVSDDKNATLCRGANYMDFVTLFNYMMVDFISGEIGSGKHTLKEGYKNILKDCGLECFTGKNNQDNRIACLKTIYGMILPENVNADAMKKDVSYIRQAMTRVKRYTITGQNDRDFMDTIIVTLGAALSYDPETKKRSIEYKMESKSASVESSKK